VSPAFARLLLLLCFVRALLGTSPASAHDLAIDELTLRPNVTQGKLRGQLTFDPALTRGSGEVLLSSEIEARVLAFVARNVVNGLRRSANIGNFVSRSWPRTF
jgi:hypothetical protein